MTKFIELKDLQRFKVKFIYNNFILRNLKRIEFRNEATDEFIHLNISKQNIENKEFIIHRKNCEIIIRGNEKFEFEFEIMNSKKNEIWKFHNPIKYISLSSNEFFYKSKVSEVRLVRKGFSTMVYSNKDFVGRIERKQFDIKDINYINVLIGICCERIICNDIYKLNEPDD
jgi:hypothetical protein